MLGERARRGAAAAARQDGFTLLELSVAMAVFGVLAAIAVPSWRSYQSAQDLVSGTRDVISLLRHAQASAVAGSSTAKVEFAPASRTATESVLVGTAYRTVRRLTLPPSVTITSWSFTARTGGVSDAAYFYSRGTATAGSVVLSRSGGSQRRITVEGVTGRVAP